MMSCFEQLMHLFAGSVKEDHRATTSSIRHDSLTNDRSRVFLSLLGSTYGILP